ncbi:MAG: hypothetical protein OEV28_12650, partial [Nitrospirota bacterium]|nr:hypothetical protein [Nitrospirota bacterium]
APSWAKNNTAWADLSRGIANPDLRVVAASPGNQDTAYAGASDALYKTMNGGKTWDEILSIRGTSNTITSVVLNSVNPQTIYVGTRDGLYQSNDHGRNWTRIFNGVGHRESSVLSIAVNPATPKMIFIGTSAGLFRTNDGGSNWEKSNALPSAVTVTSIAIAPSASNTIYAATDRGLYKSTNAGLTWEKIFAADISDGDDEGEQALSGMDEAEETDKAGAELTVVAVDPEDDKTLYVGSTRGVYVSEDGGLSWDMTSDIGLAGRDIRHMAINPTETGTLYVATGNGVFRYFKTAKRWMELYQGLTSPDIRHLAFDAFKNNTLWAATKSGVFKATLTDQNGTHKNMGMEAKDVASIFAHEPTIIEMQEAAIRYAEVHPEKIEGWRKAAERKAWLPDLRVGYDQSKDWQSGTYFYSTSTVKYKDDDITRGRDSGWSVSLTWELGDLIWNNDQTSIDTRSRLMVQLRDDVLNEVTRLYFERRRLQIDLHLSPPEKAMETLEKELRLQELTAKIDALTGFNLSRKLGRVR